MSEYVFPIGMVIDPNQTRDLAPDALDDAGRLKVLPSAFWAETTLPERAMFGVRHGLYSFPTTELVEHLGNVINGRPAIEIGAGHGVLAEALGIRATDSFQQLNPKYRRVYEAAKQAIVPYGPNVLKYDARDAIEHFEPEVVIGCWVSHRYSPDRHWDAGNEDGVDEEEILRKVATYVAVGNQHVHRGKAIWSQPHELSFPAWVWSRAMSGTPDFVARWDKV